VVGRLLPAMEGSMTMAHRPFRALQTTGQNFRSPINPRGCPGSMARVHNDGNGRGVCPFCMQDKRIRKDGRLANHARPSH
jgi:hypothetical protein